MPGVVLELGEGESVRVFGPARVRVEEGLVSVLGAELGVGEEVEVDSLRSYLLKALRPSRVRLWLGGSARLEAPRPGEEPYDEWVDVADSILDSCGDECRVMVVGPVDSGKTSFSAVLANRSLRRGLPPAIVDADVGQADIGPPGFVALGLPDSWVMWLRRVEPVSMRFVGSIEPGPVAGRLLSGVHSLVLEARARGAGVVVVDTDGWVSGWAALEVKVDMARILGASHVVVIGDPELYEFMERSVDAEVRYVRSPEVLASRGPEERRRLRTENYKRFLDGPVRVLKLSEVKVQGSCLGAPPLGDERVKNAIESATGLRVLRLTRFPGGVCAVLDAEEEVVDQAVLKGVHKRLQGMEVLLVTRGGMRRVLAALAGPDGTEHPALLLEVDPETLEARFATRYQGPVTRVVFGRMKLDEGYREVGRGRIWV